MQSDGESLQPLLRRLPLQDARAVGGPVALRLLAGYLGLALVGWLTAAAALVAAAPQLARGELMTARPVLAVHLLALGGWLVAPASHSTLPARSGRARRCSRPDSPSCCSSSAG